MGDADIHGAGSGLQAAYPGVGVGLRVAPSLAMHPGAEIPRAVQGAADIAAIRAERTAQTGLLSWIDDPET